MGWLIRGWDGDEELWKLVWIDGALLIFLAKLAVIALRLFGNVDLESPAFAGGRFLNWVEDAYCVWMLIALWRCAFNAEWAIWGYGFRVLVIAYALLFCLFTFIDEKPPEPKEVITRSASFAQPYAQGWIKKNGILPRLK